MQNSKPKVSIVLSTYNRAHLISGSIESVRQQSFSDWELLIVDDASTDNTAAIIKDWEKKDSRIKYLPGEVNLGIARNSNRGLKVAQGEYVAVIDDDDPWLDPDKLKKQVAFLDTHSDYVGVGGGMIVVDKDGKELFRYLKPETDEVIRQKMLFDNPMANSTTLFRRSTTEKVGLYDESVRYAGDRDFWLKMGLQGKLYNFPEYFGRYLMAGQNTSIVKMREHLNSSLKIMKRYRNDYPDYPLALIFNRLQYGYAFSPLWLKKILHRTLSRWKRLVFR